MSKKKQYKVKYKIKVMHDYVDIESNYGGKIEKIHLPTGMLGFLFKHLETYGCLEHSTQKHYLRSLGSYGDEIEFEVKMVGVGGGDVCLHNKYKFDQDTKRIKRIDPYIEE